MLQSSFWHRSYSYLAPSSPLEISSRYGKISTVSRQKLPKTSTMRTLTGLDLHGPVRDNKPVPLQFSDTI